jgi:hypothetical protein
MINSIKSSLTGKRKYLLIILNITLFVFVILEIPILSQARSGIVSAEEGQAKRDELCRQGKLGAYCYKRR